MLNHTAWITTGENNDPDPAALRQTIRAIVIHHGGQIITEMSTQGEWQGDKEAGHAFLITYPASFDVSIRVSLVKAAGRHRQEAIGFVGTGAGETLIKGES